MSMALSGSARNISHRFYISLPMGNCSNVMYQKVWKKKAKGCYLRFYASGNLTVVLKASPLQGTVSFYSSKARFPPRRNTRARFPSLNLTEKRRPRAHSKPTAWKRVTEKLLMQRIGQTVHF